MSKIRVIRVNTGLPIASYVGSPDFPGDKAFAYTETHEYRVCCSECGLVDKALTESNAWSIGDRHLRRGHK